MRAIDHHEDAIVLVVDLVHDGFDPGLAIYRAAKAFHLTDERLTGLVRMWCGIAGIDSPV